LFNALEILAMAAMLASFVVALLLIWKRRPLTPAAIVIGLFVVLGSAYGDIGFLSYAFDYSRAVSPVFLFVLLNARGWVELVPPIAVLPAIAIYTVRPLLDVVRCLTNLGIP